jgi:hypothetical protein
MNSIEQLLKDKLAVRLDEEKKRAAAMFWEATVEEGEDISGDDWNREMERVKRQHGINTDKHKIPTKKIQSLSVRPKKPKLPKNPTGFKEAVEHLERLAEYTDPRAAHKDLHSTALKHGYKHAGTSDAYPHGTDSSRMRVVHDYQHPSGHKLEVHSDQNGSHASYFHNTSGDYGRSKTALHNHLKAIHAPKK